MATIKDVAERVGVTVTTVSRMLNDRVKISQKTREKIHTAMEELDYSPNELARSLSKQSNNMIGALTELIWPDFARRLLPQSGSLLTITAALR